MVHEKSLPKSLSCEFVSFSDSKNSCSTSLLSAFVALVATGSVPSLSSIEISSSFSLSFWAKLSELSVSVNLTF